MIYGVSHPGQQAVHKLPGQPGRPAAPLQGVALGPALQLVGGQLHAARRRQMPHDVQKGGLVRPGERDVQPEPLGEAHQLLQSVVAVDVVALPVAEFLLDDVPPVAGGVDHHVFAFGGHRALQHRFQGAVIVVVFQKGEVVDEQHELQGVRRQLVQHAGDGPQLVLSHLHDAQPLGEQGVADGFHRRGLAGARAAVGDVAAPVPRQKADGIALALVEQAGIGSLAGGKGAAQHPGVVVRGEHAVEKLH